jgi:hypothetical protein
MGMRLAGDVARMGEERNTYRILVGNPEGKMQLGLGVGRILLKSILEKWDGVLWAGFI